MSELAGQAWVRVSTRRSPGSAKVLEWTAVWSLGKRSAPQGRSVFRHAPSQRPWSHRRWLRIGHSLRSRRVQSAARSTQFRSFPWQRGGDRSACARARISFRTLFRKWGSTSPWKHHGSTHIPEGYFNDHIRDKSKISPVSEMRRRGCRHSQRRLFHSPRPVTSARVHSSRRTT